MVVIPPIAADDSSKLAPYHRWGFIILWCLACYEKFYERYQGIDDLKIRGGWGQTGNQSGHRDYSYLARYNINRVQWFGEGNDANATLLLSHRVTRAT